MGLALLAGGFTAQVATAGWVPTAGPQRVLYADCRADVLEAKMLAASGAAAQMQAARDFFQACSANITESAAKNDFQAMLQFAQLQQMEVDFSVLPRLDIKLADGLTTPAFLAVQPGEAVRPLVIVKCGALCNSQDPALKQIYLQLFEEGAAHILLLPSTTGSEFQLQNGVLISGGALEGYELFALAREARSNVSPLKAHLPPERVGSVHVLGVSLGGQSALYAGLFAAKNAASNERPALDSVLAACPVVDFQAAMQDLFVTQPPRNAQIRAKFHKDYLDNAFKTAEKFPQLKAVLGLGTDTPPAAEIPNIALRGALEFFRTAKLPAPFSERLIQNGDDFWSLNRFQEHVLATSVATAVWGARDDMFFAFERNTALLIDKNPQVQVLATDKGNHCLYSHSFGWDIMSSFLRTLVLARSPELLALRKAHTASLANVAFPADFAAVAGERRYSLEWEVSGGSDTAILRTKILIKPECKSLLRDCYRVSESRVPLSLVDQATPVNESQAARLTRWLNGNVRSRAPAGAALPSEENPAELHWSTY